MTDKPDIVLELRTLARLIETKATVTFGEQDAAHLRKAANEIDDLRAALGQCSKLAYSAVRAERSAILELIVRTIAGAVRARGELR
jgi:hypothetical protein